MAKFKVGDMIKAIDNRYYLTSKENLWTGIVYATHDTTFEAITINCTDKDFIGCKYDGLLYEYFDFTYSKTTNPVINALLDKLDLEAGEKFNIIGAPFNPYHFKEDGKLVDKDGDNQYGCFRMLVFDEVKIEKLSAPKEMTVGEIEKILGHKVKIVKGE